MNFCILKACESFESVKIEFGTVSWAEKWSNLGNKFYRRKVVTQTMTKMTCGFG